MARRPRSSTLENRTNRLKLEIRKRPHVGPSLARGVQLLYRRNQTNGTWVVKVSSGHGTYWTKRIGDADDFGESDGATVLNFFEAQDRAKALARGKDDASDAAPLTVDAALDLYERDLRSRNADVANVRRVRRHMTSALGGKPVMFITAQDLRHWRDGLVARGLEPSTVNRHRVGLRAALELAAGLDHRITNRDVFRLGLKGLPGATKARRVVLADADVLRIVEAAYREDHSFGVLVQVLAETGARISQTARLKCSDLQADRPDPRILLPTSFKGRGQKERSHVPVPISMGLATMLKEARGGRAPDASLLLKDDGTRWQAISRGDYRDLFRAAVARAGFDPDEITSYALRHSSICRGLLAGVPTSVVARLHDTSAKEIEAHYAAFIADFADAVARKALLTVKPVEPDSNVIPIARKA
jgi:integrase